MHRRMSLTMAAWGVCLVGSLTGPAAGQTPAGTLIILMEKGSGGSMPAGYLTMEMAMIQGAVGMTITRPGGDVCVLSSEGNYQCVDIASTLNDLLDGTGAAGQSTWTVEVTWPCGLVSVYTFEEIGRAHG